MPGRNCYAWRMALTSRLLASGPGWQAEDVICNCGPADHPFEEQHEGACLAIVGEGTFSYRSTHGTALLVPGALLLGNPGACFECSHEHSRGDRCLSFHLAPEFMDEIATQLPGARKAYFSAPRLPPIRSLMPVLAAAEGARDGVNAARLEELAIQLVAEALKLQSASDRVKHPRYAARCQRGSLARNTRARIAYVEPTRPYGFDEPVPFLAHFPHRDWNDTIPISSLLAPASCFGRPGPHLFAYLHACPRGRLW